MEERTAPELDVDWLRLTKPNGDAHARVCKSFVDTPTDQGLSGLPAACGLLAVSNRWGLVCVGARSSINVFKLEDILASIESGTSDQATQVTPLHRVNTQGGRPQWVRLAARDRKVVVGLAGESGGGVWVWSLKDLASAKTAPLHVFREEALSTLELLPNPSITGALPNLVLALSEKGAVLLDIEKFEVAGRIDGEFTSAAWSARGKQVVLGRKDGSLEQYTPDGSLKATIPASSGAGQVNSLAWLENDAFLATFQDAEDEQDNKTYLVERSGAATLFDAILPPFGLDRPNGHRELAAVRGWGSTKRLGFLTSPASPDIAILRAGTATEDGWSVIIPDESARASVPLLEATGEGGGDNDDATCLGLEIDLTSTTPIKQTMSGGVEQPDLPPAPRLIEYTSDGIIIVYNIINTQDGAYAEMVQAGDILTAPEDAPEPTITPSVSSSSVASTPAPPAAASPFTAQASAKPTFGFGTGVKLPTVGGGFGQATGFGAKPAFGSSSSFGSSASQPAFGSSSSFGSSASAPAFGSSSFGTNGAQATSPSTAKPAFGSSAFGSSAVGSSSFGGSSSGHATPTASSSTPAFGSSAFGSSAFGASTTPAAPAVKGKGEEKKSGFGAFAPQGSSAFGSSAFGAGAKTASAFGNPASAGPSLFGSKPASKTFEGGSGSAFGLGGLEDMLGDDSKTTTNDKDSDTDDERGPVKESSASKPTSAFIQPSKAGSAFGAFAPNPTKSAFGSPSGSTTPSAFAGFGQTGKATTVPAFGSPSAFGQASAKSGSQPSTPTSAPAFGQTSAFGQPSSFGKSSPFGQTSAFGQAAASTTPAGKPSAGGFGSFASAIPSTSAFSGFASSTSVFGTSSADKPAAEPKKTEETPISLSADEASDAEGYELAGSQEGSDDEYYEEESAVGSQVAESEQAEYEDLSEPEDLGDVSDRSDLEKVEGGRSASEEPAADVGRTESAPAVESAKDAEHDAAATVEKPSAPAEPKTKDQDGSDDAKSSEAVAAQPSATKPLFSFGNQAPAQASKEPSTPLSFGGLSDAAEIGKQANSPSETPKDAPSPVAGPPASKAPESKAEVLAPETSQVDSKAQAKVDSSVTKPATALSTGFSFGGPAKAPSPGVTPGPFSFAKPADQAKEKSLGMSFGTASQAPTSTETKPADTSSTSKPFSFGATSKQPEPAAKPKATAPSTSQPFSFGAAPASSVSTPATAKPLFGFGFGSAATASNSTAQSTDPAKQADDETPVQPKPLFGFGASPVPTSPMPFTSATSDKPAPSAFSFGAPPATPSPKPTPPASTTPAGPPQPLFGQRPPSVKPVAAPEPPTPTPTPPPPQQAPRPSAAPSKPALPLGQLRMPSTIPARSSPLATGTSVVPSATASPPSTPAPTTQAPKREPAVLTTPTRRRTELAPEPPVQPGGLAAQAETLYRTMEARLKNLRKTADDAAAYHADSRGADGARVTAEDLADASFVPFDQLAVVTDHIARLRDEVLAVNARAEVQKLEGEIRSLVADIHSANGKAENCARYVRARSDPEFARRLRVRQLGPEQAEMQQRLRVEVKTARDRLDKIESSLAAMKRRVAYERNGIGASSPLRSSTSSPLSPFRSGSSPSSSQRERTLEKAQAAIRAMDLNAQDAQRAIESLTRRVAELDVSKSKRSGASAPAKAGSKAGAATSRAGQTKGRVKLAFDGNDIGDDDGESELDTQASDADEFRQLAGGSSGPALVAVTELASRALNAELQGAEIRRTLLEARERTKGPLVTKSRR